MQHASDCATHNAPAAQAGACDCGADPITTEMIAMGVAELEKYDLQLGAPPDFMVIGIYRAMRVGALTKPVDPPAA